MEDAAALTPETKKEVINPRVEIDTSPPFESVKEAVDRFGGSGPWIPHHLLRFAAAHHQHEAFEEEAMQLERDVIMKEQQTLNVLKELESAKRFVDGLKFNLIPEISSFMPTPDQKFEAHLTLPSEMFTELNQAKLNLSKTSIDLAAIQASVESLNKKLRQDKVLLERRSKMQVQNGEEALCLGQNRHFESIEMKSDHHDHIVSMTTTVSKEVINFEADQFKKMTEASRYEVMKAMAEIERTKNCIRMAEMRLNAAKKMEEAAKAVEAISKAERDYSSSSVLDGITLSFDEYKALSQKAKQAEELCKTKFMDTNGLDVPILEKFEETTKENEERRHPRRSGNASSKFKLRNSNGGNRNVNVLNGVDESCEVKEKTVSGFRSSTSIGDVLSRKFVVQDDVMMETHVENHRERQHVSLSQMLKEQSRLILHPNKATSEANVEKQFFIQRKKFGFIQVPIPTKKKAQPVNLR